MVGADHGGKRRAVAAVALEHVLDDFLAALVLEVHVDVRRLVALFRDKALEQQVDSIRVEFGDAKGETHRRIGCRAATLAKDVLVAGEGDYVVDGEEIAFVAKFGDQPEFFFDGLAHLRRGAIGPALADAFFGQFAQPTGRGVSIRNQFVGVVVAQLLEIEGAAFGDAQGFRQQFSRIDAGQNLAWAQVAFAVGEQVCAGIGHRAVLADGGHAVLQGAAATGVHVHVAAGHRRYAQVDGHGLQFAQALRIVRAAMQLHAQPQAAGEQLAQPAAVASLSWKPDCKQAVQRSPQVFA
ncbi:hypothetical protein D3C76_1100720 [compost metagenome]